jgi:hypothetical protein
MGFFLAAFGSGMGWLASMFGYFTSDLWVAEAYPFLSAYANPHFSLGLAITIWLLTPEGRIAPAAGSVSGARVADQYRVMLTGVAHIWRYAVAAFALAIVLPFGVVLVVCIRGGLAAIKILRRKPLSPDLSRLAWISVGGMPLVFFEWWVTITHPALKLWNAQNLTPAPAGWDFVASFSPTLLMAGLGIWVWLHQRQDEGPAVHSLDLSLMWLLTGMFFLIIPFGLQRRFLMGLYVPLAAAAVLGLRQIAGIRPVRRRFYSAVLFSLVVPSNLIVLLAGLFGTVQHDSHLYLYRDELEGYMWIRDNTTAEAVILAAPESGLYIPAYTGRRVIYGHPFETVNAEKMEELVIQIYQPGTPEEAAAGLLEELQVDYVFFGPRERAIGESDLIRKLVPVFSSGSVQIYRTPGSAAASRILAPKGQ